jgi:hypothetical protein
MARAFAQARHRLHDAALDKGFQDTPDGRDGGVETLSPNERGDLVATPHRVLLSQLLDGEDELGVGRRTV